MMKLETASAAGRRRRWLSHPNAEGGVTVACASAAPLIVLALAVAADAAHVSRFRAQVQLAAHAASLAAAARRSRATRTAPRTASPPKSPPPLSPATPRAARRNAIGRGDEPRRDGDGDRRL